ncbi:MAG: malto-oligosyltrehalose synthase, partial [Nitrosomonadales bacterium]
MTNSTTNDNSEVLEQLAARCGITSEYQDVLGKRHVTSDHLRQALLVAMHFSAETAPEELLLGLEEKEWRQPLPSVKVLRVDETITVPFSLPEGSAELQHCWILTSEEGKVIRGEFFPTELTRLDENLIGGTNFLRVELGLSQLLKPGYYRLEIEQHGREVDLQRVMTLIIVPVTCYQPEAVTAENRVWGPTVQLYGLRSRHNWGIGDFSDLRTLVDLTADAGGDVVGINPLHALFLDDPEQISPYSPSSRCFLNTLYIDVEAVPEFEECEVARHFISSERFQTKLRRLRVCEKVSYKEVSVAKRSVLSLLYRHFCDHHLVNDTDRARAFRFFRTKGGKALEFHAIFEALQEHFRCEDSSVWGWPAWPVEYHYPKAPAVTAFAVEHEVEIGFFIWLQWQADEQIASVGQQSWRRGLGVGLYQDLAVGASPGGSEAWVWQDVFATGAHAGAPPDSMNLFGQDWGLPPFVPHRLQERAYEPLIDVLRANMRHCGALRIDHVMALTRIFWVPVGLTPAQGTYVSYPLEDILGIIALESYRNHCLVIGEDLGTVPEGFSHCLAKAGVLSYRPLQFERTLEGDFKPPADYPRQSLVAVSTHDLPTLRVFWKVRDFDIRVALKLFLSEDQHEKLVVERVQDRARFLIALENEALLPEGTSIDPVSVPDITTPFMIAIHAFLARTKAQVMVVQPEDIFGVIDQINLPGSNNNQYPNWLIRLPLDLEDWREDGRFATVGEVLLRERGSMIKRNEDGATLFRREAIIPRATYRLQFNHAFTFVQATEVAPYLAELGVSHCYASSYLKARPGSSHGYDIVDHNSLNPEIGTQQEYDNFVVTLKAHGLCQILDVVPNHMGIMGSDNVWWMDVLENGPASAWSSFFDIDWEPLNPSIRGKVLLPLLGDHYGTVLNIGELDLDYDATKGEFSLRYHEHRLPVDPVTYPHVIGYRIERLAVTLGENNASYLELQTLLTAFSRLPERTDKVPLHIVERQRDKDVHKRRLVAICEACIDIAQHITDNLVEFNGRPGDAASFDLLHELIQLQGYRLAYWRVALDEINYRRFFDINDLAALRMEEVAVFDATHAFVLDLIAQGKIDGLRIDHPDGLYDPGQYFHHLQQAIGGKSFKPGKKLPFYLVIEKILADHEHLPEDWPIHGATGYRFANLVNNLFVDSTAERRMTRIYHDFTNTDSDFSTLAYEAKKLILHKALASELNVLASRLARIAIASRDTCDFTLNGLRDALVEVIAYFPVYRSYVSYGKLSVDDRHHIAWAVAVAKKRSLTADPGIFDFLQAVLTTDITHGRKSSFREQVQDFAMKFQQVSSPVMAKGVEDTAIYRYHRLISLNDVGGDPCRFGISVAAFHAATRTRASRWPHNLLATSTHDSKRSEDVRARLNVLSEMPMAFKQMLKRWKRLNRGRKRIVDGIEAPSLNDEYLLYQTLVGTWPLTVPDEAELANYRVRIAAYMIKALRESKENSSWINVNIDYEDASSAFVQALLTSGENNLFLADFASLVQPIARRGLLNSLAQTLIKLVSPGVPDIYQGCELWQFNLVDPDNRRQVDFFYRRKLLAEVRSLVDAPPGQWLQRLQPLLLDMTDGRIKLYVIWKSLALRARWSEVFLDGNYLPLKVYGDHSVHVCAFSRRCGNRSII